MQKIPLHMAAEGMVLAREVSRNDNGSGPPVCGKDVVLTNDLIKRFELMDIKSVCVKGFPLKDNGEPSLEEMLASLEHRFAKVNDDPIMIKLFDIYAAHIRRIHGDNGGTEA